MSQWINYHHLLYFKTIAEENSVSKAAEKLRVGQPTLSAQLKQFEENLGVRLFERQHKKTHPHRAGQNRSGLRQKYFYDGLRNGRGAA
ncbi:MAG: LysR family transcriptional regulator [Calothrix sp. SM1_5_4]|nr:LysR family transcriptional regulator [Calothrix sp. SM1_5_4]